MRIRTFLQGSKVSRRRLRIVATLKLKIATIIGNFSLNQSCAYTIGTLLVLFCTGQPVQASDISVNLANGKTLSASLSARTNQQWLCLETRSASTKLIRRIRWKQVASIKMDGKRYTTDQLRRQILRKPPQTDPPVVAVKVVLPNLSESIAQMARMALGLTR